MPRVVSVFQEINMMKRLPVDGIAKASDGPPYEVLWISHGLVTTHYTTYSSPLSTHGASSPHSFHHDNRFRSHERYPITSIVHVQCSQHVRAASSLDESRESITVGSLGRQPETQSSGELKRKALDYSLWRYRIMSLWIRSWQGFPSHRLQSHPQALEGFLQGISGE